MPNSSGASRQCSPDGTQSCLNADQVPSLVIKSGSVQSRGRLQLIFATGFIWPGEIAWSSVIPGGRTAIGWHIWQQTWPPWIAALDQKQTLQQVGAMPDCPPNERIGLKANQAFQCT